jgi:hypothetical protein
MSAHDLADTSCMTGHGLCLDHFGPPSAAEAAIGHTPHGEATMEHWKATLPPHGVSARWELNLPMAGLSFAREIELGQGESVAYVREQVSNERDREHAFDWVEHATFGAPFVTSADTTFAVPGKRGITARSAYEGSSRVALNQEFEWPFAPSGTNGTTDLSRPFTEPGKGLLAAIELDPAREVEYLLAINWKLRLGVGYCFLRRDFPWMVLWEENGARKDAPWNGQGQARGMEFGTTPYPNGRSDSLRYGPLFDTETLCALPARGKKTARYLIFLFRVPEGMHSVDDVEVDGDSILLRDEQGRSVVSVAAKGCEEFLFHG